ncbi:hypothetical protein DPX16_12109 [Anabarilius grahami]|uniref:Uncharacterized protein n=1 Tax=Anabarilius grahami TaxID=495550 RepID=A0A3N0YQK3_ANAGA|nr:hypothetical protein DPX16_12109 [Anabarilius grahami]
MSVPEVIPESKIIPETEPDNKSDQNLQAHHSTLGHRPVSSTMAPRPFGFTWDCCPYDFTGLPRPFVSTLLHHSPPAHQLYFNPPAPWLHLSCSIPRAPSWSPGPSFSPGLLTSLAAPGSPPPSASSQPIVPWSACQVSTMAPPSLDSALGFRPGIPARCSTLASPTADSSLASATIVSSLAPPVVFSALVPVVIPCASSASPT